MTSATPLAKRWGYGPQMTSEAERQFLFAQKHMQTWKRSRNIALLLTTSGVPDERFFQSISERQTRLNPFFAWA